MNRNANELHNWRVRRRFPLWMMAALLALLASMVLAVSIGQVQVPFGESLQIVLHRLCGMGSGGFGEVNATVVAELRAPRVVRSVMVGAGLALSGVVMQASIQNPLAEPYILGTSAGASLGATAVIMLGAGSFGALGTFGVSAISFLGAVGASLLVLLIAHLGGRSNSAKLVLAGVIVNMVCGTFRDIIIYRFPKADGMRSVQFWSMGSVAASNWDGIGLLAAVVLVLMLVFLAQARVMNDLLLGDEAALSLGVNVARCRVLYMAAASLLTGLIVSQCGIIGYVGLIIPHFSRALVGTDHRRLIPFTACMGALLIVWCDVLARTVLPGSEFPLGLVTSAVGAPLLLYMVVKSSFSD